MSTSRVRVLGVIGLVLVALGVLSFAGSSQPALAGATVAPDPFAAQYVVSGAVLLDRSFTGGSTTRKWATTCAACQWVLTDPCLATSPNGTPQRCGITGNPCPPGSLYQRVWFRDGPAMAWDPIGLICSKTTLLTPVRDVSNLVGIRDVPVPPLRPSTQPKGRAFAGLPVWFASNQAPVVRATVNVLGWDVDLVAAPTWHWTFGDGATLATNDPGGRYPAGSVRHLYRRLGRVRAVAVSLWQAQWSVQDLPPQPVTGTITQVAGVNLDVRPTRAILVPTTQ